MAFTNRTGQGRVLGAKVGGMRSGTPTGRHINRTPEQKAQDQRETEAAYQVWRSEREARKAARYTANRSRNLGL